MTMITVSSWTKTLLLGFLFVSFTLAAPLPPRCADGQYQSHGPVAICSGGILDHGRYDSGSETALLFERDLKSKAKFFKTAILPPKPDLHAVNQLSHGGGKKPEAPGAPHRPNKLKKPPPQPKPPKHHPPASHSDVYHHSTPPLKESKSSWSLKFWQKKPKDIGHGYGHGSGSAFGSSSSISSGSSGSGSSSGHGHGHGSTPALAIHVMKEYTVKYDPIPPNRRRDSKAQVQPVQPAPETHSTHTHTHSSTEHGQGHGHGYGAQQHHGESRPSLSSSGGGSSSGSTTHLPDSYGWEAAYHVQHR